MGFLRKVGRKVKKGVKKLFSTKLGRIAGSIGLYLVMGAAAKSLSGWAQSTFGQAASQAGTEAAVQAGTEAAIQTGTEAAVQAGTEIANAATNSEAANIGFNQIDNLVKEGSADLIMKPNLTDAVSDVGKQILDPIDTKALLEAGKEASRTLTDIPFSELDFGQKIQKIGVETKDYFAKRLPEDYIEDTVAALTTGAISASLSPEPEEPFNYRGVAPRPQNTGPQGAYMQEIAPQFMAANNTTRLPDFNQIMQQNMYGTGTPQAIQSVYADVNVLPLPQV